MNSTTGSIDESPTTWKAPLFTPLPDSTVPENTSNQVFSSVVPSNHISRRTPYEPSRTWTPVKEDLAETFGRTITPTFSFSSQQNQRLLSTHQPTAPPPKPPLRIGTSQRRPNGAMDYPNQYGSPYTSSQTYAPQQPTQHFVQNPSQYTTPTLYGHYLAPAPQQTHRNLLP